MPRPGSNPPISNRRRRSSTRSTSSPHTTRRLRGDQYGQQPAGYAPQGYPRYGQQPGQPFTDNPVRATAAVRPARPVRPAAVLALQGHRHRGGLEEVTGRHRHHHRRACRGHHRGGAGARFLEAGLLRHHHAGRRGRSDRCAADPDRRGQRLRRQERQGCPVQRRCQPRGEEGRHLHLPGQHRRHPSVRSP